MPRRLVRECHKEVPEHGHDLRTGLCHVVRRRGFHRRRSVASYLRAFAVIGNAPFGLAVVIVAAVIAGGPAPSATVLARGAAGGAAGGVGLFYTLSTRSGLLSLAVVITSLYPAMTVLLARVVLGERVLGLRWAGLVLAAIGVALAARLDGTQGGAQWLSGNRRDITVPRT